MPYTADSSNSTGAFGFAGGYGLTGAVFAPPPAEISR